MSGPKDHEITLPGDPPAAGSRRLWPLALAALGIALAILGTLPESMWSWIEWRPSRDMVGAAQNTAILTLAGGGLLAMAVTILALWIGRRGMPTRPKKKQDESEPTLRDKILLLAMVATCFGLALLLIMLNPWNVNLEQLGWSIFEPGETPALENQATATGVTDDLNAGIPEWLSAIMYPLFVIGMIATAFASAMIAIERVRQLMAQRAERAARARIVREIAEAADETIDDLTRPGGDAREAIIRCYARFERSLALAETRRAPWQTAVEFMRTALGSLPLKADDVASLTRLFEVARFSRHPLGEDDRDAAWEALVSIRRSLAERTQDAPRR